MNHINNSIIFDIQHGASGDMLLGSLLDLGLDFDLLNNELEKLSLPHWDITPKTIVKINLKGTRAIVKHLDNQHDRKLNEIIKIINNSLLSKRVKDNILKIFSSLATAEASVHGVSVDEIQFHEVGAIDSIIDISAFCIALEILKINSFYFNEFHFGSGSIQSAHGMLPIPVPAVVKLTKGFKSRITDRNGEIVTPTAAAILTTLGIQINETLSFTILNNGLGFGTRDYPFPSFTRSLLVKIDGKTKEEILQLECNIDDMNPQAYPYLIDKLLAQGALDAYISQISMKKGRPGILLTIIANKENSKVLKETVYRESTTLGMRTLNIIREKLDRDFDTIYLYNNPIRIKTGYLNNKAITVQPEFEDCNKIARETGIPLREVIGKALIEYYNKNKSD